MRICYISYEQYGGGSWVHTSRFIAALKTIHDDLVVHTPLLCQGAPEETELPTIRSYCFFKSIKELRLLAAMFGRRIIEEFHLLKATKPDIVILRQARYISAIPLCRMLNIPIILEINGPSLEYEFMPEEERPRGSAFWHWLDKKMMGLSTHNMVVSETLKRYYEQDGISRKRITSVPNGVDIHTFNTAVKGDRVQEKFGLQGKTVVGFSGKFAPWHGLPFLVEAMKIIHASNKYDGLAFLLVGAPGGQFTMPELPPGISIVTGHIHHKDMPEYLAAIDIFVAPYPAITPFYFSPLKILESMSMQKPVIASAQGQICELITDKISGLLYPPGDLSALIACIERLINDIQLRHTLGCNARKVIEKNFTWHDNARRILKLCKDAVEKKKRR